MTSKKNIIWATNNYVKKGIGFSFNDSINIHKITGPYINLIKPRIFKTKSVINLRIRENAEVFTPSWLCNKQNNIIDNDWFGKANVFNKEMGDSWTTFKRKISFPKDKGYLDYVNEMRMEISCGEAPYLVSRYDTVNGNLIDINDRIGFLDRKLRVINENVNDEGEWFNTVLLAYKSIYGFEWQGDNLLIARVNLLLTFIDNYKYKFDKTPSIEYLITVSKIIIWNLIQMDGVKFVIPGSCETAQPKFEQISLFNDEVEKKECLGCKNNNYKKHDGQYVKIMNWETSRTQLFYRLVERKKREYDKI